MTPEELQEIEERCNRATPGPWTNERPTKDQETGFYKGVAICGFGGKTGVFANPPGGQSPFNDAVFVAHAREDIPKLIAYIKELQYEIEMLSGSPDETWEDCGTFKDELRKDESE